MHLLAPTRTKEALTHLSSQLDFMEALLPQASSYAGSSSARDHVTSLLATLKSSAVKLTQDFSSVHKVPPPPPPPPLLPQHLHNPPPPPPFPSSPQLRTESLKTRHERAKEYTNPSSKFASRQYSNLFKIQSILFVQLHTHRTLLTVSLQARGCC